MARRRIPQTAVLLATRTRAEIDVVWSAAHVVPMGLVDEDSRARAARQLFDAAVIAPETPQRELSQGRPNMSPSHSR